MLIQSTFTISSHLDGRRLDQVLTELMAVHSRARIQSWIETGQVLLNGQTTSVKYKVREGDEVSVNAVTPTETTAAGENIALNVVYEDKDVIIINKPAGLVVHPGAGVPGGTLMNALLYHYPELGALPRAGIVHRLDKDTTGLMVVARSLPAHTALVSALHARNVKRSYLAIAQGVMISSGTVDTYMGRHPRHRTKMAVLNEGKQAVTHYHVLERFTAHTYIRCDLETGRTHQIRVHMAHLGYPLLGDPVYGARAARIKGLSDEMIQEIKSFHRQALHAASLAFHHPVTHVWLEFKAPLPDDMARLLDVLRKDTPHASHHSR